MQKIFAPVAARMTILVGRSIACTIILILPACATLPRTEFTAREQQSAEVPGFKGIRTWGDGTPADFERNGVTLPSTDSHSVRYLALSSGGSGGAFGAGVLVGWTASGSRPVFDLVSGVSTGALIAPFAFLGSEYDRTLAEIYTSDVAGDVVQMRFLPAGLFGSGILRPEPLRHLVEKYADERLLVAIAREHRKGRRLLMVTTNMDAQRAVVWDMGKIAASGRPEALKLFRDILVASASVPAVFSPVLIDVQAGGKHFQEMHADGGPSIQVFTVPEGLLATASSRLLPKGTRADLYVVINNALIPEFKVTSNNTFAVGDRGLDTMIKSQTRGSLDATYAFTKRAGIGFHVASIDRAVPYNALDPFNADYVRTLFKLGYDQAISGQVWKTAPVFIEQGAPRLKPQYKSSSDGAVPASGDSRLLLSHTALANCSRVVAVERIPLRG
jgi:hypothetical protein